jgi:hypothetical protein
MCLFDSAGKADLQQNSSQIPTTPTFQAAGRAPLSEVFSSLFCGINCGKKPDSDMKDIMTLTIFLSNAAGLNFAITLSFLDFRSDTAETNILEDIQLRWEGLAAFHAASLVGHAGSVPFTSC